jgi:hypothetical protein
VADRTRAPSAGQRVAAKRVYFKKKPHKYQQVEALFSTLRVGVGYGGLLAHSLQKNY